MIPTIDDLARATVDCAWHIHSEIGPGLLESAYEALLSHLLDQRGFKCERQTLVSIHFHGLTVERGFRADIIVEGRLLVELKSAERLTAADAKQVLTYLRFLDMPIGLLINFGNPVFKGSVQRIANGYRE